MSSEAAASSVPVSRRQRLRHLSRQSAQNRIGVHANGEILLRRKVFDDDLACRRIHRVDGRGKLPERAGNDSLGDKCGAVGAPVSQQPDLVARLNVRE